MGQFVGRDQRIEGVFAYSGQRDLRIELACVAREGLTQHLAQGDRSLGGRDGTDALLQVIQDAADGGRDRRGPRGVLGPGLGGDPDAARRGVLLLSERRGIGGLDACAVEALPGGGRRRCTGQQPVRATIRLGELGTGVLLDNIPLGNCDLEELRVAVVHPDGESTKVGVSQSSSRAAPGPRSGAEDVVDDRDRPGLAVEDARERGGGCGQEALAVVLDGDPDRSHRMWILGNSLPSGSTANETSSTK